jgi:hypothetical protein
MRKALVLESGGNFVESLCARLRAIQEKRIMELELYSALQEAGVSEERAKAVVESIKREIDQRYSLHSKQGDVEKVRADVEKVRSELKIEIANTKTEIIKWNVGAIIAAVGLFATIAKIMEA